MRLRKSFFFFLCLTEAICPALVMKSSVSSVLNLAPHFCGRSVEKSDKVGIEQLFLELEWALSQ